MDETENINLENYQPSEKAKEVLCDLPILIIVGPSGSGKDTLIQALIKTGNFYVITSHTTRPPRTNHGQEEVDGLDYHFISMSQSKEMLANKEYIEANLFSGNIYGTALSEFVKAKDLNKISIMDVDVNGVANFQKLAPKLMAIFLIPPSLDVLLERLIRRYGHAHDDEEVNSRLRIAIDELEVLLNTDYYYPVINNDFSDTMKIVESLLKDPSKEVYDKESNLDQASLLLEEIKAYLG